MSTECRHGDAADLCQICTLEARVAELEAALKRALPILRYHLVEPEIREIDRDTRHAFNVAAYALDHK